MSDSDLVKRAREHGAQFPSMGTLVDELADRIEALAARVAKLEEAIAWYANFDPESANEILTRAALDHTQSPPSVS